jgi:hypothetical protein
MKLTGSKVTETRPALPFAAGMWLSTALLAAVGCNGGPSIDPQLLAQRRALSKETVSTEELPVREGDEEATDIAMGMAGMGAPEDLKNDPEAEERTDDPEAPAPSNDDDPEAEPAPTPLPDDSVSTDSARCGDGVVDTNEQCDIAIEEGEPGSCPTECDNSDPCKPQRYVVLGCRTRCVAEEPAPGTCEQ